jgi:hypothetical protein
MMIATPFFERFSDLERVEEELKSSRVSRELPLSPHQRIGVLASIALHNGRCDEARAILREAMSSPENKHTGDRRRIEEIAERLFPKG